MNDTTALEHEFACLSNHEVEREFALRLHDMSLQLRAIGARVAARISSVAAAVDPELQQVRRRLENLNG